MTSDEVAQPDGHIAILLCYPFVQRVSCFRITPTFHSFHVTMRQLWPDELQLDRYALYMQDFGGPVGFRVASRRPEKVIFLVIQNANAYEEGLPDDFWFLARALWRTPSQENFERLREAAM